MTEVDHYQVLGVSPSATGVEIREAYRRLARLVHPDTAPEWEDREESTKRMMMLNEAYAVLRDPLRRAAYDRKRGTMPRTGDGRTVYYETPPFIRTYVQGGDKQPEREIRGSPPPPEGWPELAFKDTQTLRYGFSAFLALVVVFMSIRLWATQSLLLVVPAILLGATIAVLDGMAIVASLGGYVVLDKTGLVERWTFAWFRRHAYRYEQICGVRGEERSQRIAIDYFPLGPSGRLDRTRHYTRRLRPAKEYDALLGELRARARGYRRATRRPAPQQAPSGPMVYVRSAAAILAMAVFALGLWESSWFVCVSVALIVVAMVLMPEIR
jgi:curved DNA-binding protein CbpA